MLKLDTTASDYKTLINVISAPPPSPEIKETINLESCIAKSVLPNVLVMALEGELHIIILPVATFEKLFCHTCIKSDVD